MSAVKSEKVWVNQFNLIPKLVFHVLRGRAGADEQLVTVHVEVLQLNILRFHVVENGLVFQFELFKCVGH